MTLRFDTLQYYEKLKSADFPEAQAKAWTEALTVALAESSSGHLARKDDLAGFRDDIREGLVGIQIELADMKSDLKLVKWMGVAIAVAIAFLVATAFL